MGLLGGQNGLILSDYDSTVHDWLYGVGVKRGDYTVCDVKGIYTTYDVFATAYYL